MGYLHLYCLALGLANFQVGWVLAGGNQSQYTIATQLGWTDAERVEKYPLINTAVMTGCGLGSLLGGLFIGSGRRKTLFIFNFIIIISTIFMCILNFWSILLGKLVFGFAAAVVMVAAPKMIDETVPGYKLKLFGLATNVYLSLGVTIAMIMGLWLPKTDDIDGMKSTQLWRYISGMPAVWAGL